MIRYALVCPDDHRFEAWFRDSTAFDKQAQEGHLACPLCGSAEIRKALMAPAVQTSRQRAKALPPAERQTPAAAVPASTEPARGLPVAMSAGAAPLVEDERFHRMRALLREMHAHVKATAENVGPSFPEEARKIHFGEAKARPIYGTASGEDVRSLGEDGIEVLPLPPLPEERN